MRKLMMLIALLLGMMLFVPAMAEEIAYTDMLATWADVPYGTQDIPVSLADYEAADLGLTQEVIGEENALCWRTGLGSVTFKVVPGETIDLSGAKFKVTDIKAVGKGAKVTFEEVAKGRKRTLDALE